MEANKDKYALQKVIIKRTVPLEEAERKYKSITKRKPRKERATEDWWHFRYLPPTKFESRSFRTKVVNDDIRLVFGKLKEDHARLEGRGLFDYFKKGYDYVANKASSAFDYIKNAVSITDYSDTTKVYLQKFGDLPIVAIEVRRTPVDVTLELALQGVSQGKWLELKKKYGVDEFFHLSMVVTVGGAVTIKTKGGKERKVPKKLVIEKLAVVSINEDVAPKPGRETQPVPMTHTFSINQMFQKARQKYGDTRFFSYSALGNNNCQNFIEMCLTVEGLYTEPVKGFVFQDISQMVKELPESTKLFSQGVTFLGALANKYLGIGGKKKDDGDQKQGGNDPRPPQPEHGQEPWRPVFDYYIQLLSQDDQFRFMEIFHDFLREHGGNVTQEMAIEFCESVLAPQEHPDDVPEDEPPQQTEEDPGDEKEPPSMTGDGKTRRENVMKRLKLKKKSYSLEDLSKASGVPMEILQQVYNRGIGAYSNTESVRLKGSFVKNVKAPMSKKLSKEQWAMARVYSFLDGNPKHDEDLRKNEKKVGGKRTLNDLCRVLRGEGITSV